MYIPKGKAHKSKEAKIMRFIDRTGKGFGERGADSNIKKMGKLTRTATKIAEERKLGLLKTSHGPYRIIRECGLGGACDKDFFSLAEVDEYLKSL